MCLSFRSFFVILQRHSSLGHLHSLAIPGVHQAPTDQQVGCPSYTTQHSYDQACSVGTREPICHPLEYNYTGWLGHGQALLIRSWKLKLSPNVSKSIRLFLEGAYFHHCHIFKWALLALYTGQYSYDQHLCLPSVVKSAAVRSWFTGQDFEAALI